MMLFVCAVCLVLTVAAEAQRAPRDVSIGRKPEAPKSVSAPDEVAGMDEGGVAGAGIETLATVRLANGLAFPVGAAAAPGDTNHLYFIQKAGAVRSLNLTTNTVSTILNISVTGATSLNDERGLLGIAFHPNYPAQPYVYFNFTLNAPGLTTFIRRYTVTNTASSPIVIDAGSAFTILRVAQPFSNHNGGWIAFGPNDGYLYVSMGDGGDGCDPAERAQDITDQLLGKMLRIDVDGDDFPAEAERNYAIPSDNPFVGIVGDDEIWAYGLRNAWRCGFDSMTGDLFIADVGQFIWEEISFQPATSTGGQNYGWDCMEGNACTSATGCGADSACVCNAVSLTDPIGVYHHSGGNGGNLIGSGCSITGGMVYRGNVIPTLQGTYFYADWCSNTIASFSYNGVAISNLVNRTSELANSFGIGSVVSFAEDATGEMYIIDQGSGTNGEIYKIIPATGACCFPNGSCSNNLREPECVSQGGTWQGKNSQCATANCPAPTGACCLTINNCVNATEATCDANGGTFLGEGTECEEGICTPGVGACCLTNGSCIDGVTADQCNLFSGAIYQGDNTTCISAPCDVEATGACCLADGSCLNDLTSEDCATQGGTYQGDESACASVECPQPTGACCLTNGSCLDAISAADCQAQGGAYQGDDSACATVECTQPCIADFVSSDTLQPPPDGLVDGADLAYLIGEWGDPGSIADIVDSATIQPPPDGVVDGADLAYLLGEWGPCPN